MIEAFLDIYVYFIDPNKILKNTMNKVSVGLAIPTKNAQQTLENILHQLTKTSIETQILLIDSSSCDNTVSIAKTHGIKVITILQSDFNHGATREYVRKQLNTDIVIYLTQDAIPINSDLIANLVQPLLDHDNIVVSYGRQIAHKGADIFEAFPREYNYGDKSQIRGIDDLGQYGVYTFFCSNSCAAYKNSALNKVGGFKAVLTNEDYFAVADLLQKGYKIAYVANAVVQHSHRYTLWQEFQRYFDTGYVRAENPVIQNLVGQAESRGLGFVTALLKKVWKTNLTLIPYAVLQSLVKWLGYRIGFYGTHLPLWLRKKLSMQAYYWDSKYFVR